MNERAVEALVDAAMRGVRQIKGGLTDGEGGLCAIGVLRMANISTDDLWHTPVAGCMVCGATTATTGPKNYKQAIPLDTEAALVIHLNNDHGWSFLDIARKLESSEQP